MTNQDIIAKFRAEIKRLKTIQLKRIQEGDLVDAEPYDKNEAYNDLLSFLSDLEKSLPAKVADGEGLEEEIKRYYDDMDGDCRYAQTARHFAEWGAEHLADAHKMSGSSSEKPNWLNELADYARRQVEELLSVIKKYDDYSEEQIEELRTHLMAMFLEGAGWQKEQMMKEAVDAIVENWNPDPEPEITIPLNPEEFTRGDKVRVIIVKEN